MFHWSAPSYSAINNTRHIRNSHGTNSNSFGRIYTFHSCYSKFITDEYVKAAK